MFLKCSRLTCSFLCPPTIPFSPAFSFAVFLLPMWDSSLFGATFPSRSLSFFTYLPFSFYPVFLSMLLSLSCRSCSSFFPSPTVPTLETKSRCLHRTSLSSRPVWVRDIPPCPSAHSNCKQRVLLLPPLHSLIPVPEYWGRRSQTGLCLPLGSNLQISTHHAPQVQRPPRRTVDPCADTPRAAGRTALRPSRKVDPARQTKVWERSSF